MLLIEFSFEEAVQRYLSHISYVCSNIQRISNSLESFIRNKRFQNYSRTVRQSWNARSVYNLWSTFFPKDSESSFVLPGSRESFRKDSAWFILLKIYLLDLMSNFWPTVSLAGTSGPPPNKK